MSIDIIGLVVIVAGFVVGTVIAIVVVGADITGAIVVGADVTVVAGAGGNITSAIEGLTVCAIEFTRPAKKFTIPSTIPFEEIQVCGTKGNISDINHNAPRTTGGRYTVSVAVDIVRQ